MGGIAILTYKKHRNLIISLAFMLEMKPMVLHNTISRYVLKSPSANFEFSALMPGLFDVNTLSVLEGLDYKGNSETFKFITKTQAVNLY
jgi:hypothetical protein